MSSYLVISWNPSEAGWLVQEAHTKTTLSQPVRCCEKVPNDASAEQVIQAFREEGWDFDPSLPIKVEHEFVNPSKLDSKKFSRLLNPW